MSKRFPTQLLGLKLGLWALLALGVPGCWLMKASGVGDDRILAVGTPAGAGEGPAGFLQYAGYSYMPGRSGDMFVLPKRFNFVTFDTGDYSHDGLSHLMRDGQVVKLRHEGSTHSVPWNYDIEIPIIFYGPAYVQAGQVIARPVTQQDIVPTYAGILKTPGPEDAVHGRPLLEALKPFSGPPKAILTLVMDQGGDQYYRAHPEAHPHIDSYRQAGTHFSHGRVTHLDVETAVGHAAIGTGAYPYQHGVMANQFFVKSVGGRDSFLIRGLDMPALISSPTLADVWDLAQGNKPVIISYAYADRAAVTMAGHGSLYKGGDKDIVVYYSNKTGLPETNTAFYHLPDYLKAMSIQPYLDRLTGGSGKWMEHDVGNFRDVNKTPAQTWFDADVFLKLLEQEPVGQDDVTDLLYLTLKATDACAHAFGWESLECKEVFTEQDKMVHRVVEALAQKVGRENLLVVITADHGGSPLPELTGGLRIKAVPMMKKMNEDLDKLNNGVPLVQEMNASQIYINDHELQRNGLTWNQLKAYLAAYEIDGKKVFEAVYTKQEVLAEQLRLGLTAY